MKKFVSVGMLILLTNLAVYAQDEGTAVAKARFERSKGLFLAPIGIATTLGKNLGDYSTGFNFEVGFLKRSNKLLSFGPNFSFLYFGYDESKTEKYYYDPDFDNAIELELQGGNVSLLSLGIILKLNFIPVGDNTIVSVYGIGNPFISFASRSELSGEGYFYKDNGSGVYNVRHSNPDLFPDVWDASGFPALEADNKVSGGIHAGFGLEFLPTKVISFFIQATFSYTLPITYVSTSDYTNNVLDESGEKGDWYDANGRIYWDADSSLDNTYYNEEFPIVKNGFSALSIKAGISINF